MRKVTIYSLIDPRDQIIKYIGKTVLKDPSKRYDQHIYQWKRDEGKHNKLNSWIKCLANLNMKPIFTIISECNESNWKEHERGYIALLKSCGANLKNLTNGGDEISKNCHTTEAKLKRLETLKTSKKWKEKIINHSFKMKEIYKQGKLRIGLSHLTDSELLIIKKKIGDSNPRRLILSLKDKISDKILNFSSLKDCRENLDINNGTLRDFLYNKRKTSKLSERFEIISIFKNDI